MGKFYRAKGSEDKLIVVATEEEYKLAKERFKDHNVIKTGVGGINVIETLKDIKRDEQIVNFGYVGSNTIPVGTELKVGLCELYHPNVEYEEKRYNLGGTIRCLTSNDFVLKTKIKEPVVFDMELAYICAMGFEKLESIKIVSDNLSIEQYEEEIK